MDTRSGKNLSIGVDGISGYAAVFNQRSEPIVVSSGSFIETIRPGAFRRSLAARGDVVMLLEHDASLVLARRKSGTLSLSENGKGLFFEVPLLPATGAGRNAAESVRRGDIDGCSFGFTVPKGGDTWTVERSGGASEVLHTLIDVSLIEVSLTVWPAYPRTSVAMRSLERWARDRRQGGKSVHKVLLDLLAMQASGGK